MSREVVQSYKHKESGYRIRELAGRKDGKTVWQVDCGRSTGRLLRKTFTSRTKAEEWAIGKKSEAKQVGKQAFEYSDKEREDIKTAMHLIKEYDCTLRKAVQYYIDRHQKVDKNNDLAHMVDLYWKKQKERLDKGIIRARTYKECKNQLKAFRADFKGRNVASIDTDDITAWLDTKTNARTARENYRRYISILFNMCLNLGKVDVNPTPTQDDAEKKKAKNTREPKIYTVNEVQAVMDAAKAFAKGKESRMYLMDGEKQLKDRNAIVAYLALNFWAGIRPAELERLSWSDITLRKDGGSIYISAEVSKTNSDRRIAIEPNLAKWLAVYKSNGLVFPYTSAVLRSWRREVFKAAGVEHKQDAGRHSYASHYLAKTDSLTKTRVHLGHTEGSDVLFKHYISLAEHIAEDAEAYFDILPTDQSKVVRLKTA